jgi:hypothetical protein
VEERRSALVLLQGYCSRVLRVRVRARAGARARARVRVRAGAGVRDRVRLARCCRATPRAEA